MGYSIEKRERVVALALKGNRPQREIADKYGIGLSTLQKWVRDYRAGVEPLMGKKQEKRPRDWTGEEKLAALVETAGLDEAQTGQWCRKNGIHTHHLAQWKQELTTGAAGKPDASVQSEIKKLREANKQLQKELRRKEKALAETTALLVLKKKADAIWGEGEDD